MLDDTGTVPVDIRLLEIQRTNVGNIRAYAAVEIEVAGVTFVVQGITIVQAKREVGVDLPTFIRDGRRLPTFVLPAELYEPVGRLVLEAYREALAPV
jgi:DNA-binding cell septation regulator SpoVG